jgi:putative peptide zinc metalloprotease protein
VSHDDLLDTRPALRPDLTIRAQGGPARRQVRLADPREHRSHDLGWSEYEFVSLLDGRLTLREAVTEYSRSRPQTAFSAQDAVRIVHWLRDAGLLSGEKPRDTDLAHRLNPFVLRWPLFRGDRWAHSLVPILGPLFTTAGFVVWLITVGLALLVSGPRLAEIAPLVSNWFLPTNWLGLAVIWTLLKVLHEAGHAASAAKAGAPPREAGITLLYFAPLAYVDLSATWRLSSRTARIITALAGVYVELLVAAVALLAWRFTTDPVAHWWLANIVLLSGVNTLLFNLNPLARLDGYFVLADLCDEPNLGPRGRADLHRRLLRVLFGPHAIAWTGPAREPLWICLFALASQVWSIGLLTSVLASLAAAWSGAGLAVALTALVFLAGPLLVGLATGVSRYLRRSPAALARASAILFTLVGVLIAGLWLIPSPWVPTAACLVEFDDGATVRAPEDAFVDTVHIPAGATVQAGDLLMTLRSDSLLADHAEAVAKLGICRLRDHLALERQDTAAARIFARDAEAAQAALDRLAARLAALSIRAPRAGVVVSETLTDLPGTFVSTGTELLLVGDPAHKRLTALLAESEVASLRAQLSPTATSPAPSAPTRSAPTRSATFQLLSGRSGTSTLDRIDPRASTRLEHPALAATHGGPLAVRASAPSAASKPELAAAHATLTLTLDPATSRTLELGETGRVSLAASHRPLAETLERSLSTLWTNLRNPR